MESRTIAEMFTPMIGNVFVDFRRVIGIEQYFNALYVGIQGEKVA